MHHRETSTNLSLITIEKGITSMLDFAKRYGCNIHSQFNEDGIIDEILKRLKLNHGVTVEFGAPTKTYCSNTYNLDNLWQKYFFDIDPSEPGIIKKEITP